MIFEPSLPSSAGNEGLAVLWIVQVPVEEVQLAEAHPVADGVNTPREERPPVHSFDGRCGSTGWVPSEVLVLNPTIYRPLCRASLARMWIGGHGSVGPVGFQAEKVSSLAASNDLPLRPLP